MLPKTASRSGRATKENSCAFLANLRIISFFAVERPKTSCLRSFRSEMLLKSVTSSMMYPNPYPMGFVICERLWWRRFAGSFSIPLTPPKHGPQTVKAVRNEALIFQGFIFFYAS